MNTNKTNMADDKLRAEIKAWMAERNIKTHEEATAYVRGIGKELRRERIIFALFNVAAVAVGAVAFFYFL